MYQIFCVCVFCQLYDFIIWVWACICKTTSHDLSMLNYPEDSIQKDRYSFQTPKNKRVKLWIQHSRCLVSVYMCVWVEINQSMLSHTAGPCQGTEKGPAVYLWWQWFPAWGKINAGTQEQSKHPELNKVQTIASILFAIKGKLNSGFWVVFFHFQMWTRKSWNRLGDLQSVCNNY